MAVAIHRRGRVCDDSSCDDHHDVQNAAGRGTIQFAMDLTIKDDGRS